MNTEKSVLNYTQAYAPIFFADGALACDYCPVLETYARKQCRMSGEYLSHNTKAGIGNFCPLIIIDNNDMEEET